MTGELKTAFVFIMAGALSALLLMVFIMLNQNQEKGAVFSEEKEKLKASLQMTKHENVSIYYADKEKPLLALTKETLDDAASLSRTLFDSPRTDEVDLIFFSSRDEMESFSNLKDITGFYSEEMRMIGLLPEEKKHLLNGEGFAVFLYKRVLTHEYTHYSFHGKLRELKSEPGDYPLWFHEGVAEWAAAHDTAYARALPAVVPLRELKTDRQWQKARTFHKTDIYLQSFYIIEELIAQKGRGIILHIIEETAERKNFESGFKAAVGQELTEFEKKFKQKYENEKTALNISFSMPFLLLMNRSLLSGAIVRRHLHLRLSLSRCKSSQHFLHVLRRKLRHLVIAMFVLVKENFIGHFDIVRNLVCQHSSADRVCHLRSSHGKSGRTRFNQAEHKAADAGIINLLRRLFRLFGLGIL